MMTAVFECVVEFFIADDSQYQELKQNRRMVSLR